jgi:hypothetical protein
MDYKYQFSPMSGMSGTPNPRAGSAFGESWRAPFARREDATFFRSWLVYDSDLDATRTSGRFNWNIIAGLLFMAAVSAAGWSGLALLARYFWK